MNFPNYVMRKQGVIIICASLALNLCVRAESKWHQLERTGGGWNSWQEWSLCSQTCGEANQIRIRRCKPPSIGKKSSCKTQRENGTEIRACSNQPRCTGWTEWNSWDECTMTCGGGLKQRAKHCMDTSSYEILEPISCGSVWNVTEQKSCNTDICAVWNTWKSWESCSVGCGNGTQERNRSCLDDLNKSVIADIACKIKDGLPTDARDCIKDPCPIDGNWEPWSEWGDCSVTCHPGIHNRSRSCAAQQHGGNQICELNTIGYDTQECNDRPCDPENGVWEPWGDWSSCYDSCAAGRTQERNRTCHGPFYEGQNCSEGGEREEISCPSCPAQTGSCPASHWHSFHNGYFCCKIYRSEIDPTTTLGNDHGKEHCSAENTLACPSLPSKRCKVADIRMIQCPDINYPFANFEGCCKTREHQTYETACKDGEGIIVEDCQGLENKCDGFQLPLIGSKIHSAAYLWTKIQDRNLATDYYSQKLKVGEWIEVDLLLPCQVQAISFDFAAYPYDYNIYVGSVGVGLPDSVVISGVQISLIGTFCGDLQGSASRHEIKEVTCQNGPLDGKYVQIVTKSVVYIQMYELYIHIVDYYGRQ